MPTLEGPDVQLYGRAPRAVVLGIAGERFGVGEQLSPAVRRALPRAVRAVLRQAKVWGQARLASPPTDEDRTPGASSSVALAEP